MEKLVFSVPWHVIDPQYYPQHTLTDCLFHETGGPPLAFFDVIDVAGFGAVKGSPCVLLL